MKRKPELKLPEVRLTEKLRNDLIEHIQAMIGEVMGEHDVWKLIDEHVQEEYKREGVAWLEVDKGVTVLCSIGSGDAVFRLPLDLAIDIDDEKAPQDDNKRRVKNLTTLIGQLGEVKDRLSEVIERAHQAKVAR